MPGGGGTGPLGQGPGTGRGMGRGAGRGRGRGRMGGQGLGPSGKCVCPKCGKAVPHEVGIPCYNVNCPSCGTPMTKK